MLGLFITLTQSQMKNLFLSAVLTVLVLSGCNQQSTVADQTQNEKIATMEQEISTMQKTNEELAKQVTDLQTQVTDLKKENKNLKNTSSKSPKTNGSNCQKSGQTCQSFSQGVGGGDNCCSGLKCDGSGPDGTSGICVKE